MSTIITAIDRHSPAEKAGIQVGEQLLTINGHTLWTYWITAFTAMTPCPVWS